jgi:hypothetical protein
MIRKVSSVLRLGRLSCEVGDILAVFDDVPVFLPDPQSKALVTLSIIKLFICQSCEPLSYFTVRKIFSAVTVMCTSVA